MQIVGVVASVLLIVVVLADGLRPWSCRAASRTPSA